MTKTPTLKDLSEQMHGLAFGLAEEILQTIPADREAGYARAYEAGYDAAILTDMTDAEAEQAGKTFEACVRVLVQALLAADRGEGGRA